MALNFDARTVAPQVSLEPVPEAWYKVVIRKSNIKPTRDGQNGMLAFDMEILEGAYAGRVLWWNLNLFHSSQAAVEIAYKQLSAICHVVGQYNVQDQPNPDNAVPMLHNIPFFAHAVIANGQQGPINNIKGVKDINGNEPGKSAGGVMPQQPAQPGQPPAGFGGGMQPGQPGGFQQAPGGYTPPAQPMQPPMQPAQPPNTFQPTVPQQPGGWTTGPAPAAPQQPMQPPAPQYQPPMQPGQQGGPQPQGGQPWQGQPQNPPPQGQPQPGQAFNAPAQPPQAWQPNPAQPPAPGGMPQQPGAPWQR